MAITIREVEPVKLSGRSSLLVSFPYSPALVEIIKKYTPAIFHKKITAWEIQSTYLSEILDELTYYDSIELILRENEIRKISSEPLSETEIISFKQKPYKHQIDAINYGLSKDKWLLLDSPGCGKTLTAMCYAETLHKRGLIDHCLIIVGFSSLKQNWKKEIKKFSNESCIVIGEKISKTGTISYTTLTERAKQLKEPISEFFVIVNIEVLRDKKIIEAISSSTNKFGLIVVDEIHKCAGTSSEQFDGLKKLEANYKIGMSGSLITNNPISAYGPLYWTDNDHATLTNYKQQYCEFGTTAFTQYQIIGYKNLCLLKDELDNCSIRRTFDQISKDLPEKIIEVEYVEMSDAHRKFYDAIKNGVKEEADKIALTTGNLLSLCTRLRQATAACGVLTTDPPENSKVLRCADLVEELVEQDEKVVILCNFKETVYDLARRLEKFQPLINTGDQSEFQISTNIDKFQNDASYKVFIGTHARAGTGITLNAAKYLICIDVPWTWASFDQSTCRIYRINNKTSAFIKVLCCVDTIDERVWEIVENKKELSEYLVDGVENTLSDNLQNEMKSILRNL